VSLRTRLTDAARAFAGGIETPPEGELAGHGSGQVASSYIGDLEARVGTYNPEKVTFTTMRKMQRDPTIKACMALSELALRFSPWDVDGPDPLHVEFVRAALEPVWGPIVRSCGRTGVNEGCAMHETVWAHTDTHVVADSDGVSIDQSVPGWTLAKVKDINPESAMSILVDGMENFQGYGLTYPNITLAADRCFHFATNMRFGNCWGEGRLGAAYDPWYQHRILTALFMRYMARRTTPAVHVQYPAGESDGTANSDTAKAIAMGFQSDATSAWTQAPDSPDAPKWAIDLIESTQTGNVINGFLAGLKAIEMRMMLAMLTPEKVLNGDGGSNALSESHKDVWIMGVQGTLQEIIDAVNDQLVPRLIRYTFGDVAVPRVVSAGFSDESKAYLGSLFTELVKVGGVDVDGDSIAERLGVPTRSGESAQTKGDATLAEARVTAVRLADELQAARLSLTAAM
jgi:hypothetical protein